MKKRIRVVQVSGIEVIGPFTVTTGDEFEIRDEKLLNSEAVQKPLREGKIEFVEESPPKRPRQ